MEWLQMREASEKGKDIYSIYNLKSETSSTFSIFYQSPVTFFKPRVISLLKPDIYEVKR